MERDKEDLARTLSNETGKCITEARAEIGNIPIAFKAFSERAKHFCGQTIPFNFPCDLFDQKVAPALLTGNDAFYDPIVIGDVPKTADVAKDMEIFGPVVPILAFKTEEEALEIANASKFGLCGFMFSENMRTAARVANALECGGAVINGASFFRCPSAAASTPASAPMASSPPSAR